MARSENNKSLRRKVRNSYFISTVSIALVLFTLGSVGYLILNAMKATKSMRENMTIHVMLVDNLTQPQTDSIRTRLTDMEAVKGVKYTSKKEAAESFKSYLNNDFEEFLAFNPLPDAFEVNLKAENSDNAQVRTFDKQVSSWPEVAEVVYQKNIVEQISANVTKFNIIMLLFGGALLAVSLILLNNTLRLTIYSKRYLINTMKMVGASKWFIMKPFLGRSMLHGLYAWLIAGAMFIGLVVALGEGLPEMTFLFDQKPVGITLAAMFIVSELISLLFTAFAVNKFVNMHSSKINLY